MTQLREQYCYEPYIQIPKFMFQVWFECLCESLCVEM